MKPLILYHGKECSHCHKMMPIVEEIESELNFQFERKEIWHNTQNKEEFKALKETAEKCCGDLFIPAFYNPITQNMLCQEQSREKLTEWIKNQK